MYIQNLSLSYSAFSVGSVELDNSVLFWFAIVHNAMETSQLEQTHEDVCRWRFSNTLSTSVSFVRNVWRYTDETMQAVEFAISSRGDDGAPRSFLSTEDLPAALQIQWGLSKRGRQWYVRGYVPMSLRNDPRFRRCGKNGKIYLHSVVRPEYPMIDHINHNGMDNRRCNLRNTTISANGNNRTLNSNSKTGVNGVNHLIKVKCYRSAFKSFGKTTYKRYFYGERSRYTKEQAFAMAVAWRRSLDARTGCTNGHEVKVD